MDFKKSNGFREGFIILNSPVQFSRVVLHNACFLLDIHKLNYFLIYQLETLSSVFLV